MTYQIHLFAGLAEAAGAPVVSLDTAETGLTAGRLKELLAAQYPKAAQAIRQAFVARNQAYAADDAAVSESDELALIPPVSGGQGGKGGNSGEADGADARRKESGAAKVNAESPAGSDAADEQKLGAAGNAGEAEAVAGDIAGSHAEPAAFHAADAETGLFVITADEISVEDVTRKVIHPDHGAALAFVGTTREHTAGQRTVLLEYEAYLPMAVATMKQLGGEIAERWPGTRCAITHRIGRVGVGETSVVIAVSSPHRGESYDASRYAIERLKQIVPIWKKEIWEDGSEWKGHQKGPWDPTAALAGGGFGAAGRGDAASGSPEAGAERSAVSGVTEPQAGAESSAVSGRTETQTAASSEPQNHTEGEPPHA